MVVGVTAVASMGIVVGVVALLALVTEARGTYALCFLIRLSLVCQQEGASLLWFADRSILTCLRALVLAVR